VRRRSARLKAAASLVEDATVILAEIESAQVWVDTLIKRPEQKSPWASLATTKNRVRRQMFLRYYLGSLEQRKLAAVHNREVYLETYNRLLKLRP